MVTIDWAALIADVIKAVMPQLLQFWQQQKNTPTVIHYADPTPEVDAVVADAALANAGL